MTKRLFIFTSWDPDCIIDDSVEYYANALSEIGDIVFVSDCDTTDAELEKIKRIPNVLHIINGRHGEYDFGSYKRGYEWAAKAGILDKYDWVYLVNDSAYGPLRPLGPILSDLESGGADAVGMYYVNQHSISRHLQSWFIGVTQALSREKWFAEFLHNVKAQEIKDSIIIKYEFGLTALLLRHDCKLNWLVSGAERSNCIHNPVRALKQGLPFLKKSKIALCNVKNIKRIQKFIPENIMLMIKKDMDRRCLGFSKYNRVVSFRLFGVLPALDIEKCYNNKKYKITLFKYIPVLGINL